VGFLRRRMAAQSRVTPTMGLKMPGGRDMAPPRKAAGTEARTKGISSLRSKYPAPENFQREMPVTMMFRERAVNRMSSVETPTKAMEARYPDPPP
jgi:hypothetical protein